MSIIDKLGIIQSILKAPKHQYNTFGKYYYRSCEDILEAAKPICLENGVVLVIRDEIVNIGDRFYVKAEAILTDAETKETITNVAYAREEEKKSGMDGSQITGTASSYARKYCLNGLFCIDDTKDADTDENHNERAGREQRQQEQDKKHTPNQQQNAPSNEQKQDEYASIPVQEKQAQTGELKCSNCGKGIAENIFNYSLQRFRQPLCYGCQQQFKKG